MRFHAMFDCLNSRKARSWTTILGGEAQEIEMALQHTKRGEQQVDCSACKRGERTRKDKQVYAQREARSAATKI